jgi:superfamily II DNA helicase RecQ
MDEILSRMCYEIGFVKSIKDCQEECLMYVLSKNDVMAILPTGYRKGLFFQVAPCGFVFKPPC